MNAAVMNGMFGNGQLRGMAGPLLIVMILSMMILPLPPWLLDLLFTFNIALGLMVLLTSMYTTKPLDFAAFPTILLLTTLLRLSLNVASTRVVLLHGHTGPDAAGKVIEAFGHFLVGGNFAVGLVVFVILVVINFVVITKGAGRIAEVSARFTLDAMPGKQMAIDADLNAGLIGEAEARQRRAEIAQEAEFYGSMDGASKFVRGDAIAGILILLITLVGGLVVGVMQHDLSMGEAGKQYVLLAVGDGLVAQIPALVISTAAGLVVSRVGTGSDLSEQVLAQLFARCQVLNLAAGVLFLLGIIPGMPHFAFLFFGSALAALAYWLKLRDQQPAPAAEPEPVAQPEAVQEATWDDIVPVDTLGLEVGYRLIPLVDKAQDGELLRRIKAIRKKFAQEVGFLPPAVHIRDNLELKPAGYRITLKGVVIGEGEAFPGQFLAINPGRATGTLPGAATKDPAFGLPATWIDASQRDRATTSGFTVVDAGTVIATHLSHLVTQNAAALLGRAEVQQLIDHFSRATPKLIDDLVPKLIPFSTLQKVLQNLLAEGVHVRDLRTIVETLTDHAAHTQDATELTGAVRIALGASIVQQIYGSAPELSVIVIEPELEKVLNQALAAEGFGLEPGLAETLLREAGAAARHQEALGLPTALLVPDRMRAQLARLLRRALPQLRVLAHAEIPDSRNVRVSSVLGG
ncbi:MAG TPA: flagellar biosynthesis protein FlhA, partial [Burkholderiales bacterium]|nr:flagellar biosynthesis protein FlhA [Burkholderiales bacterium]